jgi:hypothetical protein
MYSNRRHIYIFSAVTVGHATYDWLSSYEANEGENEKG